MIQIHFRTEYEEAELLKLRRSIYNLDSDSQMCWWEGFINYDVRVDVCSKIADSNLQQIKSLCKKAAICNYIELFNNSTI